MTLLEKPALTEALQQLSALLPVALETCTGSESESQNSAVVEKVRSVLLDVIGTITCSKGSGKQVLAVLKILQIVMDRLPAAFSTPVPQFMLTISVVQLLGRLGCHSGAVEEQHVPILCGLAHLVQHNDRQVLLELHASTVDLLLDLEHLMFEMAAPSSHAASLRLPLFHGLLIAAQERLTEAAQQQPSEQNCGSQEQQTQQLIAVEPVMVVVQDGATWQAYASLALRFLLFQLQEYPVVLGAITPPALVSAVSQMLSYPSSELQELCLNTMAIMVVQQAQRGALVLSVMQHVAWLLECAAADQIPADICTSSWQLAAAGCLAACVTELSNLGLLDAVGDKLVNCLCTAVSADALQCQRTLWLSLLRDVLVAIPSCSAAAALALPLTLLPAEPQTATVTDFAAAEAALIDVWQVICSWAASEGIVGVIDRQAQLVYPGLRSSAASVTAATGEASGDMGTGSPVKKKRKKLKQAQLTVSEGGFLSSQRPGRPSNSQQPSDTTPVATQTPPAELAADTLQQLLRQQHPDTVATAATRLAGLIACLGPNTPVPATFAAALGLSESTGSATGNIDSTGQTPVPFATHKVRLLQSILHCLLAAPYQSPALLACVAQQVIAWLPQLSVRQDLVDQLLPALLLALVATAGNVVATPVSADIHRATWQAAVDWMQGASSLWSTGLAGPPSPLLAAISVAWLTLAKLINRNSNTSVSTASAQMHACCTSSHPASVVAAVQLLPVMCLTQHGYFEDAGAQEQCPAVANTAAQQQMDPLRHNQQHSLRLQLSKEGYQQSLHSLLGFLPTPTGKDAAAIQLSAVQAVSQVLHVAVGAVAAVQVAGWLRDATAVVMQLQGPDLKHNITGGRGISTAADGGQKANILDLISGYARSGSSSFPGIAIPTSDLLPPLRDFVPVLEALTIPNNSDNSTAVQCAALHFLGSYLTAVNDSDHLSGSRQPLLDALQLITSRDSRVRDTALKLVQQYLKPAVLQEAFGAEEHRHDKQHDEDDVTTTPHGRLLQHLQQLSMQLSAASETAGSRQQLTGVTRAPESVVAAKTSLLRAVAGLYGGLLGSGCEHFPLLYLLEHQCPAICPDDRVQACALDLLQFLANQYASSKDPGQLLLDSQATPALLTYVGKALARQPQLFTQLALAAKVDEGQLAEAVAPYVVHWLCQKKLTEALQLLASKLGQSASSLFLSKSDEVLAEQLWFNPDGLASLIEWVDALLAPDNTFLEVVRVMGRRMARCVIQTAGLAQFWGEQHRPPKEVLARASEYVGTLADVMKSEGVRGVAGLLQGETMATLLKNIGKTLSKQQQQVLAPGTRPSSKQQQQQQHLTAAQADQEAFFAEKLQGLRSLMVMMYLLGDAIGSHALQLMAVLSEALLYCTSGALLVQALSGWLSFIQLLAQWAPEVLQRVAAQAAVVLLPILELTSQPSSTDGSAAASAVKDSAVQLAAAVLHEMVVRQRASVKPALKNMPPLPTLDNLKEVNAVLAQEQDCQTALQKLQLLVAALRHESVAVRHVGLGEVRNFLLQYKTFMGDAMTGLLNCSGPAAPPGTATAGHGRSSAGKTLNSASTKLQPQQCRELHSELLSALLASCDNLPRTSTHLVDSMKQRCAQCLGMLGAIDPAHVSPELPSPTPFAYNAEAYLVVLVQQHLVRVLQTACDIGQLEVTSYAIQQILQHYTRTNLTRANKSAQAFEIVVDDGTIEIDADPISPDEPGSLYSLLDNTSQSIVRPFLTTKFCVTSRPPDPPGVVFGKAPSFRRWLHAWLKVLMSHSSGPLSFAFEACRGVAFWDQPLMLYLLPFMLVEVAGQGGEGLQLIVQELTAVMQSAASGPECQVDNIELYVHCIFNQLDLLKQWVQEQQDAYERAAERAAQQAAQQAAAAGNNRSVSRTPEPQLPTFVVNVSLLVNAVPIQIMAEAALRCGSYARALQYFEVHVRGKYGGGLNPSAYEGGCDSYNYDDVSFLLEVYGHLEEPDGLAGLVQLRQGGLTAADQILVAEKAGDWSEALALYEQALAQEAAAARAAATAGPEAAGSWAPGAVAADALTLAARAVAAGSVTWSNFNAGSGQIHRLGVFDQRATGSRDLPVLQLGTDAGPDVGAPAAAQGAATAVQQVVRGISSLQVGHLRCLLHMGHHQTLLHQVDGLMARCLGSGQGFSGSGASAGSASDTLATLSTLVSDRGSAAAQSAQWCITQLAALGVAASWRLGAYELLRGYLGIVEAASLAGLMRGSSEDDWEACVGYILEAAHRGSDSDVTMMIKAARQGILSLLPFIAGESYTRAYPDLMKLHMLQEIEDAWGLIKQGNSVGPLQRSRALRWPERLSLTAPMLSSRAPLLALRRQLAGLLKDSEGMGRAWLQHAKLCRSTGHQEAAETSILEAQARNVPGALLERCRLLWDRDKGHRAVMELQIVVQQQLENADQPNDPVVQHQRAKELLQLTEWMSAVGQGGKEVLCANYDDAIQLDYNWEKAHFSYACYLDQLYKDAKQREGKGPKNGMDRLGGRCRVRREEESPFDYLPIALSHYGESIRAGHKHILQSLPRLLTLYFEFGNRLAATKSINQKMRNAQVQISGVMKALVRSIPTYKWLLVLPQLTSRLCHQEKDVQEFIQTVLVSIVDQFPQQALWSMTMVVKSTVRARQEIATAIISSARRRCNESGRRLFDSFSKLMDQLIRTCMWQPPSDKRMSRASAQREFKALLALLPVEVQVPVQALFTVDLPPGGKLPSGHRPISTQATIAGMKDEVVIMQSLMKPKKITFIGSDGVEYPFLAKPKDDLRKDYRLMDFAGTLNALFARQPQARRRGLSLRTYAVLPLTNDCGILQWVNNLVPFKHACEEVYVKEKIYKRHSTPMQIKKMYDSHSGTRRELMDKVLSLLPPRMSKWFLSKFSDPGAWLKARLAFTRTNAAWAMVGHVLGLGDRHGENIMINALTGETMHVDFGCLFDHGLTLEVPEMVPFRLTQNVVDCFGVSGVEGTFRCAAEMTLQVLRDNKATLMTCAETFLHDPLVDWTKGSRSSSTSSSAAAGQEHENPQAKDALFVMEGRLSGTLLGVLATPTLPLSCEGQAARLIQEASDHENLGKMYIWWMPWL